MCHLALMHDDVIKWKHFPRYWPFVRGIHRSPVNSPHKGQWRRALMFSLICIWIDGWVNNREAGDLRRYHAHYDIIVMELTHKHPETHRCILSIVTTDVLVLKHQTISTHSADQICIPFDQFNRNLLHIAWTKLENKVTFGKKYPVIRGLTQSSAISNANPVCTQYPNLVITLTSNTLEPNSARS